MKKKAELLKPRGIRFDDAQWAHLNRAARERKPRITPSDINRELVEKDMKLAKRRAK